MFFGVKRLCTLPLEQFHWSGVSFLPDLTVPDPYYILQIALAVLMNLQFHVRASALCDERFLWLTPFGFYRSAQAIWQRRRIDCGSHDQCLSRRLGHFYPTHGQFSIRMWFIYSLSPCSLPSGAKQVRARLSNITLPPNMASCRPFPGCTTNTI
jgi:hypothetical protein